MDLKGFFKPTKGKIIVFIIIIVLGILQFYFSQFMMIGGAGATGFPFEFGWLPGCASSDGITENCWGFKIVDYPALIGNIVVYYLISCLIILAYNKIKKK